MNDLNYSKLKVLVADDFSNFRSTINGMLGKLGICSVDLASNGDEVLNRCQGGRYDLILCDYDLGPGRNGQQVLEELRFRSLINRHSVFIIVSADAAKDVVLATYDCEPDDYLMKPITAQMLQKRMSRLLQQRRALGGAMSAVESGDFASAIGALIDVSIGEGRYAVAAQKLLGEAFIANNELDKAEKLYSKALESRQLDWARLGLARVKQLKGELDVASEWLEKIVGDNPLYLPAYDILAENFRLQENSELQQQVLQRAVDISPRSILRQKGLAQVAEKNDDFSVALNAQKSVVRLGELSCHASAEDSINLARIATKAVEQGLVPGDPLLDNVRDQLNMARKRFVFSEEQSARVSLLEGHAFNLLGKSEDALGMFLRAEYQLEQLNSPSLEMELEWLDTLQRAGQPAKADALVAKLVKKYAQDQFALQQLDLLLSEPVSQSSQDMVATVNREGIHLYNQKRFDEAIACFEKVLLNFPKHVGVHLNIVQSLLGKLKSDNVDESTSRRAHESLDLIEALLSPGDAQYARFERLKMMACDRLVGQ